MYILPPFSCEEKVAFPLDYNPHIPCYRVFGAIMMIVLSSKSKSFNLPVCHSIYTTVNPCSAHWGMLYILPPLTTMKQLPSCSFCVGGRADEYQPLLQPPKILPPSLLHSCTLGTIPSSDLKYAAPSSWISKAFLLPRHSWIMQTVAVWHTALRLRLSDYTPTLIRDWLISESNCYIINDPVLNACHPSIETNTPIQDQIARGYCC